MKGTTLNTRGFNIPAHDEIVQAGFNADGNPATVTYRRDGVDVMILTFTYDGGGNCTNIVRSQP